MFIPLFIAILLGLVTPSANHQNDNPYSGATVSVNSADSGDPNDPYNPGIGDPGTGDPGNGGDDTGGDTGNNPPR